MTSAENKITSAANASVKKVRSLAAKKYRDEEKLFVVEGMAHIRDALENGWEAETLLFTNREDVGRLPEKKKIRLLEVTDKIMESIAQRDNPQAVIGVFKQRGHKLSSIENGVWIGLENIRDPGNLGTIIRTADAAGVKGVILIGSTCDPWSPETIRATTGSFARIPLIRTTLKDFLEWRTNFPGQVIGTHLEKGAVDYRQLAAKPPLILLMGGEQSGLSEEICAACDVLAHIPMPGGAQSLNLSVSTGVMVYEILREPTPLSS